MILIFITGEIFVCDTDYVLISVHNTRDIQSINIRSVQ